MYLQIAKGITWPLFENKPVSYNLRNGNVCILLPDWSSHFGINLVQLWAILFWSKLPSAVTEGTSIRRVQTKIATSTKKFAVPTFHVDYFIFVDTKIATGIKFSLLLH